MVCVVTANVLLFVCYITYYPHPFINWRPNAWGSSLRGSISHGLESHVKGYCREPISQDR